MFYLECSSPNALGFCQIAIYNPSLLLNVHKKSSKRHCTSGTDLVCHQMAFVMTRCFGLRNGLFRLQSRLESGRMVRYFAEGTRTVQAEVIGTKTSTISSRLAENWGRAFVGGSCIAGIGAMCFYGLGLSKEAGAIDKAA